jgi:hypothetical protein
VELQVVMPLAKRDDVKSLLLRVTLLEVRMLPTSLMVAPSPISDLTCLILFLANKSETIVLPSSPITLIKSARIQLSFPFLLVLKQLTQILLMVVLVQ